MSMAGVKRITKSLAARVPGGLVLAREMNARVQRLRLRRRDPESVFSEIHAQNRWDDAQSVSGTGSNLIQTEKIRRALPELFAAYRVSTLLDLPCGDFNWMRHVDLRGVDYVGADIVPEIIERNRAHERPGVRFERLSILDDPLPRADMILVRDLLVHFSYADIARALRNVGRSGATYLLTTTFTGRDRNRDIATGQWRPLNLAIAPLEFPPPLATINEGCREGDGRFADKSLALWRVRDIAERAETM